MKRTSKQPAVSAIPASGYVDWLQALSRRYRQSQIKAAIAVNSEMLRFYFSLGADIVRMEKDQPWGSGFLKRLSSDLRKAMPDAQCFSVTNLKYMRGFFRLYAPCLIGHQVGGHLEKRTTDETMPAIGHQAGDRLPEASVFKLIFAVPWRHHIAIIDKFRTNPDQRQPSVRNRLRPSLHRRNRILPSRRVPRPQTQAQAQVLMAVLHPSHLSPPTSSPAPLARRARKKPSILPPSTPVLMAGLRPGQYHPTTPQ